MNSSGFIKRIISIFYSSDEQLFEVDAYKLPIAIGGAGKMLISNLHILKNEDYDTCLVLLGGVDRFNQKLETIKVINVQLGENKYNFNLLKSILNKPSLGVKELNQDDTVIFVYGRLILAFLIKLFNPRSKIYLFFASSFKGNIWAYGHKNILIKIFFSTMCLFSLLLVDRIVVDKKDIIFFHPLMNSLKEKVFFLPNSVDMKIFNPSSNGKAFHINELKVEDRVLLYVGRLDDEISKNPELLFRSFDLISEKYENIKLVIVGVSHELFNKLIKNYNVKHAHNIINIGIVPNNSLPDYYRVAHLTLLTSNFEGTPFVVLESLACGTPCVVTDVLDKDLIKNGINGYVSYSKNADEFTDAIEKGLFLSKEIKDKKNSLLDRIYDQNYRKENLIELLKT
jgi:glycosyltransferase involved in cell wall biosynthesis